MGIRPILSRILATSASFCLASSAALAIDITTPSQTALEEAIRSGGLVRLSFDGTITLTNTLEITNNVILDAQNHSVTLSGNNAVRLIHINPGASFSATNVTFANGRHIAPSPNADQPGLPGEGGAILSEDGVVQLISCTFVSNSVTGGTSGIGATNATGAGRGGAIAAFGGSLLLDSVTLSSNSAFGGVGVLRPDWYGGKIADTSGDALGGAIFLTNSSARVVNCLLTNNLCFSPAGGSGPSARGGAVFLGAGDLVFSNTCFKSNTALGGTAFLSSSGSTALAAQGAAYGGAVAALHGTVSLARCQILSNTAQGGDGEMNNVGGHGWAHGGGVYLGQDVLLIGDNSPATLSAVDTTFSQNSAAAGYGAASQGWGGALYVNSLGLATLTGCSFLSNSATGSQPYYKGQGNGVGGAIYNCNSLQMTNCTVALNNAKGGSAWRGSTPASAYGGGIYNSKGFKATGDFSAVNVTLASNSVSPGEYSTGAPGDCYGANICNGSGTVSLQNCILAYPLRKTSGFEIGTDPLIPWSNVFGPITDAGHNISSDATAGFATNSSSRNSLDPLLLPLADNGGPTLTMALATNSPAINAGTAIGAPLTDQRGLPRPTGAVDAGAYELQTFQGPTDVTTPSQTALEEAIRSGGLVRLSFDGTITLTNTLEITNNVILDAQNHSVTLSGNNAVRLIHINPGASFSATNVTFANGRHIAPSAQAGQPGFPGEGGAILSEDGVVQLISCTFVSNSVTGGPGGTGTTNATGAGRGGAIAVLGGSLLLDSVTLSSNSACGGVGVPQPLDWPPNVTMPDTSGDALGGAVFITNSFVRIFNSLLTNNVCSTPGGGAGASARGGAVFLGSGDLVFSNTWFRSNTALGGKITICSYNSTYLGAQSSAYGGAVAALHGTVSFAKCQILSNIAQGGDGEMLRAGGHGAAQGGGLFLGREVLLEEPPAILSCVDTTFSQNRAIAGFLAASQGCGGALYINRLGFATLTGCSFISNSAGGSSGHYTDPANGMGGAIYNCNSLTMTNCTVALNLARGGSATRNVPPAIAYGGGIYNNKGWKGMGNVTAVNVTVASNYVAPGGWTISTPGDSYGANIANASGTVSLQNCILAYPLRSFGEDSWPTVIPWSNVWGPITDAGHNISSDATAGFATNSSSRNSLDPLLLPLADNGGATWTMALATNSPAIDAGTVIGAPSTDQRGLPRPTGLTADIGAFEFQSAHTIAVPALLLTRHPSGLHLTFETEPKGSYVLHYSPDLIHWTNLQTFGPFTSKESCKHAIGPNEPSGFYKLSLP